MAITAIAEGTQGTNFGPSPGISTITAIATGPSVGQVPDQDTLFGETVQIVQGTAAKAADAVLLGGGTSALPNTSSTADAKFIEFRCKTTATSGDNRLAYLRYEQAGAGGGGEALRAFTVMTAALGTAHGAHLSLLTTSTTGYVTGLGAGMRATLQVANAAVPAGGTYYGAQVEIYSDGASSSVAAVTKHAVLNIAATGNATGMATVLNAIAIDGTSAADATKMISSVRLAELPANSVAFAVLINGVRYYVPCVLPSELN